MEGFRLLSRRVVLSAAAAALLLCLGGCGAPSAAELARDARLAELQVAAAEADAAAADRWRAARVGAVNAAVVAVALVPVLAVAAAALYGWKRRAVWMPRRSDGALPFAAVEVGDARAALAARHSVEHAVAVASAQVPQTITWSPRSDYRNHNEAAEPQPPTPAAVHVPTFGELLAASVIGKGQPLYLGTTSEGPLQGSWRSLYSSGMGGLQGSGKTWEAAVLALQALLDGTEVTVIDPHDGDPESLGSRLEPVRQFLTGPVASRPRDVLAAVKAATDELARRGAGHPDRSPRLLVVDEWTGLQRGETGRQIAEAVEAIVQEGRKLAVNVLLLGQRWSSTRGGGNDLRNPLTSSFVFRMRPEEARMLTGLRADALPSDMLTLAPGECYVQTTAGDFTRVTTPRMSAADVASAAAVLTLGQTSGQPVAAADVGPALALGADGGDGPTSDLRKQVRDMYLQGSDLAAVTDAVSGARDRSAGTWKRCRRQVEEALRAELNVSRETMRRQS